MRHVADFLGIAIDEDKFPAMVEHCTFDGPTSHPIAPIGCKREYRYEGVNKSTNDIDIV
jgi:hypothetical protein